VPLKIQNVQLAVKPQSFQRQGPDYLVAVRRAAASVTARIQDDIDAVPPARHERYSNRTLSPAVTETRKDGDGKAASPNW
jgi:hypothetical protein